MSESADTPAPGTPGRFLRVLGLIWLVGLGLILGGAIVAPYLGQITDTVLAQTMYRQWTRLALEVETPVFDRSTPVQTVRSYYSALYHGDAGRMSQLTTGSWREQMRQRLTTTSTAPAFTPYRSFVYIERQDEHTATVLEKFHLFWGNGLRFALQRDAAAWVIVRVESTL